MGYGIGVKASASIKIAVESRSYAPPPLLCMLALGKTGEGAYSWDSDIYM